MNPLNWQDRFIIVSYCMALHMGDLELNSDAR